MDILKHDPVAFFVSDLKFGMSNWLNTLAKGNGV